MQKGFTLLEILIAIVVLSIGLFGLAGLQATSLKTNTSAYYRSAATALAYDIIDRMRANRIYATTTPTGNAYITAVGQNTGGLTKDCTDSANAVTCDPAELALFDVEEWKTDIANRLPQGDGIVTVSDLNDPTKIQYVTVTIQWQDFEWSAGSEYKKTQTQNYVYSSGL